jgi:hypothetical protein
MKNKRLCLFISTMMLMVAIATPISLADKDYSIYDINGDCVIDEQDADLVNVAYGWEGEPGAIPEDINKDGKVDIADISGVVGYVGISYDCDCEEEPDEEKDEVEQNESIDYSIYDINGDCIIDETDVSLVTAKYGWEGEPGAIPEDINKDGKVDISDVSLVTGYVGISYECECNEEPEEPEEPEQEPEPKEKSEPEKTVTPPRKALPEPPIDTPVDEPDETSENDSVEINENNQTGQNNTNQHRHRLLDLLEKICERANVFRNKNSHIVSLLERILLLYKSRQVLQ